MSFAAEWGFEYRYLKSPDAGECNINKLIEWAAQLNAGKSLHFEILPLLKSPSNTTRIASRAFSLNLT